MKKDKNKAMTMLIYRINRYRAMGEGIRCQELSRELNRLRAGAQN